MNDQKKYLCLAMLSLAVATSVPWLLRRFALVPMDLSDGVHGFLMGIAIGINLLVAGRGIRRHQRM